MPTKLVVLPIRPVGSDTIDTLGLKLEVKDVKAAYRDVAKVVVEGTQAEIDKIDSATAAFTAFEVAAYEEAQAKRAAEKAAGKAG